MVNRKFIEIDLSIMKYEDSLTRYIKFDWVTVSDCSLTPTQQFFSYIMGRKG
jgi:hypothetical protein